MKSEELDLKIEFAEISSSLPPEEIMRQFVNELGYPISRVKNLSVILQGTINQDKKLEAVAKIHYIATTMASYINSIINYLTTYSEAEENRAENDLGNPGALEIPAPTEELLERCIYELRLPIHAIKTFSELWQVSGIAQDKLLSNGQTINEACIRVEQIYTFLSNYQQMWFEVEKNVPEEMQEDIRSSKFSVSAGQALIHLLYELILPISTIRGRLEVVQELTNQDQYQEAISEVVGNLEQIENIQTSINMYYDMLLRFRKDKSEDETSLSPEKTLEQFNKELKHQVNSIRNLIMPLQNYSNQDEDQEAMVKASNIAKLLVDLWNSTNNNLRAGLISQE